MIESTDSRCCLCSQISGESHNDLLHKLAGDQRYVRRVFLENQAGAALPSLGPLVDHHVLVAPREHWRSFASLPAAQCDAVWSLVDETADLLTRTTARPVHRFEHGDAVSGDRVSCSVEHAHLHLVPLALDPWPVIIHEVEWRQLSARSALASATDGGEYLYYEHPDGSAFVAQSDVPFESQLLRRLIVHALDLPVDWNWRREPNVEKAARTHEQLQAAA